MDASGLSDVVDAMEEVVLSPGKDVITQGEPGDYFYVVDGGEADVYVSGKHVSSIGRGGSFGELALMYNAPRAATVRAKTDVVLWALDRTTFQRVLVGGGEADLKAKSALTDGIPLFNSLTAGEKGKLADVMERRTFSPGEAVMKQGDFGDALFIVESGEVAVHHVPSPGATAQFVATKRKGDYFGEIAILTNQPRTATVTAAGAGQLVCYRVERKAFTAVLGSCEDILRRDIASYKSFVLKHDLKFTL